MAQLATIVTASAHISKHGLNALHRSSRPVSAPDS
jgi:hypothetical protein